LSCLDKKAGMAEWQTHGTSDLPQPSSEEEVKREHKNEKSS